MEDTESVRGDYSPARGTSCSECKHPLPVLLFSSQHELDFPVDDVVSVAEAEEHRVLCAWVLAERAQEVATALPMGLAKAVTFVVRQ